MKRNMNKLGILSCSLLGMLSVNAFAADGSAGAGQLSGFGASGTIIWLVIMIAIFYFLLIRPQKKKEKADRQLRASLQAGDKIVTIGGFTGRVLTVKDDEVCFETGAAKTRLTVKKWAIQTREGPEADKPAVEETSKEKETEESK